MKKTYIKPTAGTHALSSRGSIMNTSIYSIDELPDDFKKDDDGFAESNTKRENVWDIIW